VGPTAKPKLDAEAASTTRCVGALDAEWASSSTSTPPSGFAVARVRRVTRTSSVAPVFNLAVEGEHEYVANGVLVHNCLVYLCRAVRWHRDCRPAPVLDRGLVEAQRMMLGRSPHNLKAMVKLR
jgi:hypothetical protein